MKKNTYIHYKNLITKQIFKPWQKFWFKNLVYAIVSVGLVFLCGLDVWKYTTAAMVALYIYGVRFK